MPNTNIKKLTDKAFKYGPFIILAIAFIPALINVVTLAYGHVRNYGWNILYYSVGYETGFGGRKLLGTFCHLILPDFVKLRHIRTMVIAINFIMVILFVLFVGKCFEKNNNKIAVSIVTILYVIGPFSIISFMNTGLSVAFIETYQIALTLLWLIIWINHRGNWPFYIATLLISATCCLLHHTFCCTLFPLYVGLFAYDIISRNKINKKNLIGYGAICCILLGLLISIWQFSHMTINIDQLNEWLKEHVAVDIYEGGRDGQTPYYYMTNNENRAWGAKALTLKYLYGELLWSLILMSPLLIIIYYPWFRASLTAPTRLLSWRYRLVWILITIITLPIFFMATDYNRWFVGFFLSMFSVTIAVLSNNDRILFAAVLKMVRWFKKYPIFLLSIILYISSLHSTPSLNNYGLEEAIKLWDFLKGLI